MPTIVQFLHTSEEAKPGNPHDTLIEWNNNDTHRRKFIVSEGRWVKPDGEEEGCKLNFWGEWEAQSNIIPIKKGNLKPPNYFNFPYLNPSITNKTHNTDPNVFGRNFKYVICKQATFHNILTHLKPNSIILFGSCINDKFCLDTVFVVSDKIVNYDLLSIERIFKERGIYYYASIFPIYGNTNYNLTVAKQESCRIENQNTIYTYYESVSYLERDRFNNMYSYVPCKVYEPEKWMNSLFIQPEIDLDFIKHKQTQGINSKECTIDEIISYWKEIDQQIDKKKLIKGTYFKNPPLPQH
jgi:hypothetical protein